MPSPLFQNRFFRSPPAFPLLRFRTDVVRRPLHSSPFFELLLFVKGRRLPCVLPPSFTVQWNFTLFPSLLTPLPVLCLPPLKGCFLGVKLTRFRTLVFFNFFRFVQGTPQSLAPFPFALFIGVPVVTPQRFVCSCLTGPWWLYPLNRPRPRPFSPTPCSAFLPHVLPPSR